MINRFGKIDALVNNAGIFRVQELTETATEDWDQMIAINRRACFMACVPLFLI